MEAKTICQTDLANFETIKTKYFEIGYYSQKSPLKNGPNEDSLGFIVQGDKAILAVADGVGGSPKGEEASSLIISNIIDSFKKNDTLSKNLSTLRQQLLTAIENSNKKLIQEYAGARTTLTACIIHHNVLQNIQIGDSNLITCGQKGLLKYKSIEHSPVGFALSAGLITEKEALTHPERHLISNVIGDIEMHIDIGPEIELAEFDTALIASDGVFDNYLTEKLIKVIRKDSLPGVLQKLTETFQVMRDETKIENFYKIDDVSFIVCRRAHS